MAVRIVARYQGTLASPLLQLASKSGKTSKLQKLTARHAAQQHDMEQPQRVLHLDPKRREAHAGHNAESGFQPLRRSSRRECFYHDAKVLASMRRCLQCALGKVKKKLIEPRGHLRICSRQHAPEHGFSLSIRMRQGSQPLDHVRMSSMSHITMSKRRTRNSGFCSWCRKRPA